MKFVVLHPLQTINLLAAQVCVFLVGSPFPSSSAAMAEDSSDEEALAQPLARQPLACHQSFLPQPLARK